MAERKHKRETTIELDPEEMGYILEPTQIELGSGYTLSVDYDENDKPVINIKTYGQVDLDKLRKEIQHTFPNAKIRQINQNQSQTITVVKKRKRKSKK